MKTIKVIDLLNKIAKGEEVPKEIKYDTMNYYFRNYDYKEVHGELIDEQTSFMERINFYRLNDEIEIIEEEKEIEEITLLGKEIGYGVMSAWLDFTSNDNEQKICSAIESIGLKINELVREANGLKKEGK